MVLWDVRIRIVELKYAQYVSKKDVKVRYKDVSRRLFSGGNRLNKY